MSVEIRHYGEELSELAHCNTPVKSFLDGGLELREENHRRIVSVTASFQKVEGLIDETSNFNQLLHVKRQDNLAFDL